jgi:predicted DNA-binding transcriptional regulator YafY
VKHWVLGWGKHAEILKPDFLREEVVRELSDCVKAYTRVSRKAKPV